MKKTILLLLILITASNTAFATFDSLLSEDGTSTVYNLELLNKPLVCNTYTISYVTNSKSVIPNLNGVTTIPNQLPTPFNYRYSFDGWYMDSNFTV